jgi:tRNA(Ile)-lysidine synthase
VGKGNVEQEARRARYTFFAESIAAGLCDSVATGHTLDDQAETVLARFLRGAGTAGLSGIRPRTHTGIIRPLIDVRREAIRQSLRDQGVAWQEDCSNVNTVFLRNRIRVDVMPQLAQLNPSLPEVLASTAEWAWAEEEYWDRELRTIEHGLLVRDRDAVLMRTGDLLDLPEAAQRRILRRAIENVRGSLRGIDFRHVEAIRSLSLAKEGSGRIQLPDLDIYRSFDWLRLAPVGFDSRLERDFEAPLSVPGRTGLSERLLTVDLELVTPPPVYNKQMNALDWERCAGSLTLRNWRPGDSYAPVGRSGAEKIKTLFQEYRVPLWERRSWPVIVRDNSILWTRQFGVASEFAAHSGSNQVLLVRESQESNRTLSTSKKYERARKGCCVSSDRVPGKQGAEVS